MMKYEVKEGIQGADETQNITLKQCVCNTPWHENEPGEFFRL